MARLTREESRAQTREKLLTSAGLVFARLGFGGASIDRIAEEAGYSKGAFYSNFESKEDIFLQLIEHVSVRDVNELQDLLKDISDPQAIIEGVCKWANAHSFEPDMRSLVLELIRYARQNAALTKRHTELFKKQWKTVGAMILKAFPAGKQPASAIELGALVMELTYANAVHFHAGPTAGDLIRLSLGALLKSASTGK